VSATFLERNVSGSNITDDLGFVNIMIYDLECFGFIVWTIFAL